jgi:hypothetical protein
MEEHIVSASPHPEVMTNSPTDIKGFLRCPRPRRHVPVCG